MLAQELVSIQKKLLPSADITLLASQYELAELWGRAGRLDEAESIGEEVLCLRQANPRTQPWDLAKSNLQIASLYRRQGKLGEAKARLLSLENLSTLAAPRCQALLAIEKGRLAVALNERAAAIKLFLEAEVLSSEGDGEMHPDAWLIKLDRAELIAKLGQRDAASTLAKQIAINAKPAIAPTSDFAKRLSKLGA